MNRRLKICVGFIALAAHGSFLYWVHQKPIHIHNQRLTNSFNWESAQFERAQKRDRTELIAHLFDHLGKEKPEIKRELYELKAEYAPHLELPFPKGIPLVFSPEDFTYEAPLSPVPTIEKSKDILTQAKCLIETGASSLLMQSPPLAEISFEDEKYDDFGVIAGSEHFDTYVEYVPKQARPGYVFKVTFLPRADVHFKRIRQNFYFLLDRSNSMPRNRYFLNKQAVARALDFLHPGDRFNILVFDDHVVRFSSEPVEISEESATNARVFLDKQAHGGYFAATELYASLDKIIPQNVALDEINAAILLSDGDTYLSQEKQRLTIGGWTARNEGKVSLYTVASGGGNNLPLLELLSAFNKGVLIFAQEHDAISERLAYLMRTLQNPIGKKMIPTAITEDKSMTVLLQPKMKRLPDLYQNRPFVIYGSTNRLSDFVLFLQGRYYGKRFDIKKKISFNEAKMGSFAIERSWTQLLVQEFYERYFEEGSISYLETAKQLLLPLNLPTPLMD